MPDNAGPQTPNPLTLRPPPLELDPQRPFEPDPLKRKGHAERLTRLLGRQPGPVVMTLSADWGRGKTVFCQQWTHLLESGRVDGKTYHTIWFNAWENDYAEDPLLSFTAAVQEAARLAENPGQDEPGKIRKLARTLGVGAFAALKAAPRAGAKFLTREASELVIDKVADAIDDQTRIEPAALEALGDAISATAGEAIEQGFKKQEAARDAVKFCQAAMAGFVEEFGGGQPVFIFIDELDRCRPAYAVELLEHIKHLFDVPGVVFVLSVDRTQLCHAASALLGFDPERADHYLARFIDFDFRLPDPNLRDLIRELAKGTGLEADYGNGSPVDQFTVLVEHHKLPLRRVLQLWSQLRIAFAAWDGKADDARRSLLIPFAVINAAKPGLIDRALVGENVQEKLDEMVAPLLTKPHLGPAEEMRFSVWAELMSIFHPNESLEWIQSRLSDSSQAKDLNSLRAWFQHAYTPKFTPLETQAHRLARNLLWVLHHASRWHYEDMTLGSRRLGREVMDTLQFAANVSMDRLDPEPKTQT